MGRGVEAFWGTGSHGHQVGSPFGDSSGVGKVTDSDFNDSVYLCKKRKGVFVNFLIESVCIFFWF